VISTSLHFPALRADQKAKRESGRKVQIDNIAAAKAVADIIRTTLGPRSMLKMLLDATGGIVLTNDGNSILREIDVSHPAAKSMIDLSRTQDEEVGDGTTSVIIVAGEMLQVIEPFLQKDIHPTRIVHAYLQALDDTTSILEDLSFPIETSDRAQMLNIINSCIGTKFTTRFGTLISELALDAVLCVANVNQEGNREIDIKKFAKVEKLPGGTIEDCRVLKGVMFNKDVVAPGRMRRQIKNPRILLLDCSLEYKKGENQTNVELMKEDDWAVLLKMEEDWIQSVCATIASFKPDLVITEKGLSDLATHFLAKQGISAIRRLRKTDNNRIARAVGATIVNRVEEIKESDIGTGAGIFDVQKIGEEYFSFIVDCAQPKACSIILRGASRDVLNEVERNLQDAMGVARNVVYDPRLLPGGGAAEMAISKRLQAKAACIEGVEQGPYRAVASALEIIPRTLMQNCGTNVIRTLTKLRAKHAENENIASWGVDGNTGKIADMKELGVWEPLAVKAQTIKTAIESACMLIRIDDIVSGLTKKGEQKASSAQAAQDGHDEDDQTR